MASLICLSHLRVTLNGLKLLRILHVDSRHLIILILLQEYLKLEELTRDITVCHVLGVVIAHIHVIEFQKRSLPHCHMLIFTP